MVKIFKNFKEKKTFKPEFGAEGEFHVTFLFEFVEYIFESICVSICAYVLLSCIPTGIFGGFLLGVRSNSGLAFYDWESSELIRRIEIQPKHVSYNPMSTLSA